MRESLHLLSAALGFRAIINFRAHVASGVWGGLRRRALESVGSRKALAIIVLLILWVSRSILIFWLRTLTLNPKPSSFCWLLPLVTASTLFGYSLIYFGWGWVREGGDWVICNMC